MSRPKSDEVTRRNQEMVAFYQAQLPSPPPLRVIGERFGMSPVLVAHVLRVHGAQRPDGGRRERTRMEDLKPISSLHAVIGAAIGRAIDQRGDVNRTATAMRLRLSTPRLTAILLGVADPTLSEMVSLAELTGKPLTEFLLECQTNVNRARVTPT